MDDMNLIGTNELISDAIFAKDKNGKIRFWKCIAGSRGFETVTGNLDFDNQMSNFKSHFVNVSPNSIRDVTAQIHFEMAARYKHRVNSGFRYLIDMNLLYDAERDRFDGNGGRECLHLHNFLMEALPVYRSDDKGNLKPMKCKTYTKNKVTYPRIGQPKINGIRGTVRWGTIETGEGVFKTTEEGPILYSIEGHRFILPGITNSFTKDMFFHNREELIYDGELYIHGESLNRIRASIPMALPGDRVSSASGTPDRVQFWCFDLAILKPQRDRLYILKDKLIAHRLVDISSEHIESMLYHKVLRIPYYEVGSDMDAEMLAARCIEKGFEGCILRDPNALYGFGYRGKDMYKLKHAKHTECVVIDVIPKPKESETGLFILRNDINEETFECNPMGTFEERKNYLDNKEDYIGKNATVKFYERSGVKKCPFHANVETIRDYE